MARTWRDLAFLSKGKGGGKGRARARALPGASQNWWDSIGQTGRRRKKKGNCVVHTLDSGTFFFSARPI